MLLALGGPDLVDGRRDRQIWTGGFRAADGDQSIKIMADIFDLQRFIEAQANSYETALAEIARGTKRTHWMWFIFPQIAGLGASPTAQRYAIGSLDEARAYLSHPILGPRYRACVAALQDLTDTTAKAVFGSLDAMKLRSSLTLFAVAGQLPLINAAIDRWFGGEKDIATLDILDAEAQAQPTAA